MDEKIFETGIRPEALPHEKLETLIDLGVSWDSVSQGFDLRDHTLSVWRPNGTPTQQSINSIDSMRDHLQGLIGEGLEPTEAAEQLQTLIKENKLPEILKDVADDPEIKNNPTFEEGTITDEVQDLLDAGFSEEVIAAGAGVVESTVKKWETGKTNPKPKTYKRVDNLRLAMKTIVDSSGLDAETAAIWMQSPIGSNEENIPIEKIALHPELVFGAIDIVFVQPYRKQTK